jgi:hypothetical protein
VYQKWYTLFLFIFDQKKIMSECIEQLISIKGVCEEKEGTDISTLPGISYEVADRGASTDDVTGREMLTEIRKQAAREIIAEFTAHMAARFQAGTILSEGNIGYFQDNKPVQNLQADVYQGIQLYALNDSFIEVYVHEISVMLESAITTDLIVYDVTSGREIDRFEFTSIAGAVTVIPIERVYKFNRQKINLAFVYDGGLSNTFQTSYWASGRSGCLSCPNWGHFTSKYIDVRGVKNLKAGAKLDRDFKGVGYTNGLSIHYTIQCGSEAYLCQNREIFRKAFLYKFGEMLYRELLFSKRLNSVIAYYGDDHKALMEWAKSEYEESMQTVIKGMRLPDSLCFNCQRRVGLNTRLP